MAAKYMKDYLTAVVAGYASEILSIPVHSILPETGDKTQIIHIYDDGSVSVASVSDTSYFDIELQCTKLSESNFGILLDLWHNTSKANGREKTFYWDHPKETNTYVVRFMAPITKKNVWLMGAWVQVDSIKLRVEGYKTP